MRWYGRRSASAGAAGGSGDVGVGGTMKPVGSTSVGGGAANAANPPSAGESGGIASRGGGPDSLRVTPADAIVLVMLVVDTDGRR
jgi:hypothetical protein